MHAFNVFDGCKSTLCNYVRPYNYAILRGKSDTIILIKLMWAILENNHKEVYIKSNENKSWPLVIFRRSRSFSQDAKEASRASVIFLLVPGVNGGTCAGISRKKYKEDTEIPLNINILHFKSSSMTLRSASFTSY